MEEKTRRTPAVRNPGKLETPVCHWCGGALPRSRSDRVYCSDVCRMGFNRWRDRLYNLTRRAMADIKEVSEYAHYPAFVDPNQQIRAISTQLERYREITERRSNKAKEALET